MKRNWYISAWGPLEANYVTCYYLYVTDDLWHFPFTSPRQRFFTLPQSPAGDAPSINGNRGIAGYMVLPVQWKAPLNYYVTRSRLLRYNLLYYSLYQNINCLGDIQQVFWALLGPLFKRPAPSACYQKKGPLMLYIRCSPTVHRFFKVLELSVLVSFKDRTVTP